MNKQQLERKTCGKGTLVIRRRPEGRHDVDSGTRGNFWALDDYTRTRNGTWLNSIDGAKGDVVTPPDSGKKKRR